MMMLPEYVSKILIDNAIKTLREKKGTTVPESLRIIDFTDGKAAQIMHIGPYDQVERSYDKIISELNNKGLKINGKHHEIYLSGPRRTPPEKLKTILRIPYK